MSETEPTFKIPADMVLPEELQGETPREVPEAVKLGYLSQSKKRFFWGCIFATAMCWIFNAMPFVETLQLYILPLGYLSWIGLGIFGIAVVSSLAGGQLGKAKKYIVEGKASFGQVQELVIQPSQIVNGQTVSSAYHAIVQVLHPETDMLTVMAVKSRDFPEHQIKHLDTHFRVEDYVPVVWLPEKFEKTLQIYDFLELTEDAGLIRQKS